MNAIQYTPQPGGGAWRICQWFLINREEHLTTSDIAQKFDIPKGSVSGILERSVGTELLMIVRDAGTAYAAGPRLHEINRPAVNVAMPTPPATAPKKGPGTWPARRLPDLDVSAIPIKRGAPLPPVHLNRAGEGRYTALLDKLTEPGMSVELPKIYRATLAKSVAVYSKYHLGGRKFVVRTIDREKCGVWRTE